MFTRDTKITMCDGHPEKIGDLADADGLSPTVATKGNGQAQAQFSVAPGEYVELSTESGRKIKCSPRAKLMLAAGGFVYAGESNGATVEGIDGPEKLNGPEAEGKTDDLVSIRLSSVHTVLGNGFWFLVD
ncbi:MAG: hypothetical protein LAO76_26285 [Acidobacteriia bacterium]|nr:hypothetical protein [Terriglobia bacterium]